MRSDIKDGGGYGAVTPLTPALSRNGEREQEATPDSFLWIPA